MNRPAKRPLTARIGRCLCRLPSEHDGRSAADIPNSVAAGQSIGDCGYESDAFRATLAERAACADIKPNPRRDSLPVFSHKQHDLQMMYITGLGHGGPGLVANAYLKAVSSLAAEAALMAAEKAVGADSSVRQALERALPHTLSFQRGRTHPYLSAINARNPSVAGRSYCAGFAFAQSTKPARTSSRVGC
jgi:hypothetical protein